MQWLHAKTDYARIIASTVHNRPASLAAATLVLLSACATNSTPTPTFPPPTATITPIIFPTPPVGWHVHAKRSFQIALPDSWEEIALQETLLKSEIETAQNDNPPLAEALRGLLESGQFKSLLLYAADKSSSTSLSNVAVTSAVLPVGSTVEQLAKQAEDALPQTIKGAKIVGTGAPLLINGDQAEMLDYEVPLVNAAGQVVKLRGIQYILVDGMGTAYILTITGNSADADKLVPLARQIAESFVGASP